MGHNPGGRDRDVAHGGTGRKTGVGGGGKGENSDIIGKVLNPRLNDIVVCR